MRRCIVPLMGLALLVLSARSAIAADPPFQVKSADGKSSLSIGFLAQPQAELLTTADGADTAKNVFVRRLRLMLGGTITERISFFIETDSPNLGKGGADGLKVDGRPYLQDVILTMTARPEFQVDAGMLLVPVSHNSGQSAATLLAVDYGPYSFLMSDPTNSNAGRDYGVQARGYIARHLEYRAGVFQGRRSADATTPLRYLGRAVWYPLDAETGFFYSGTNHGTKRIVAVGGSWDYQGGYHTRGLDLFVDHPVRGRDAATFQANFIHYDGAAMMPSLAPQNCWLVEGGYYIHSAKVQPYVQVATRDALEATSFASERKYMAGMAYWGNGHRYNLKVGVARLTRAGGPARTQLAVQGQVFMW